MPPDVGEETRARRRQSLATDTTGDEDAAICARVQKSHGAAASPPGKLLPNSEGALLHFQRTIIEMMAVPAASEA